MARRIRHVHDDRIGFYGLLHEAHGRLERVFAETLESRVGIASTVHEVLLRLARSPEHRLKVTELGAALDVTTGGATRLVNRVVAMGMATKRASRSDKRVQWVELTDLGRDVVERATRLHLADLQRELFDRTTPAEREVLATVFERLRTDDDDVPAAAPDRDRAAS